MVLTQLLEHALSAFGVGGTAASAAAILAVLGYHFRHATKYLVWGVGIVQVAGMVTVVLGLLGAALVAVGALDVHVGVVESLVSAAMHAAGGVGL